MPRSRKFRIEKDTLGRVRVPSEAWWGAQTQRACENFPVSGLREHPVLIHSYVQLKKAAALANYELRRLDRRCAKAIVHAADQIIGHEGRSFEKLLKTGTGGKRPRRQNRTDDLRAVASQVPSQYVSDDFVEHFVVDVFQAGAGTSFHMNVNEVIANLANVHLGGERGTYEPIHPNDHVNTGQSTNDTFPTATRVATLLLLRELLPALDELTATFEVKGEEMADVIKSGRTHLQDAVPVTLGQEFRAYGAAIRRATDQLVAASASLRELGIGGTATGTGLNTPRGYRYAVVHYLTELTGLHLTSMKDLREAMQSQLPIAGVSAALRNLAIELSRISNDLRLLSSGPLTGLAEIRLPAVQPGSSIMPGKVNPVMAECMNMVAMRVIGADATIAWGVGAGQLELNVMMPLMADEILFAIEILKNYVPVFTSRCVAGISADRERCEAYFLESPSLATALNPIIGYERAAKIAKESVRTKRSVPDLLRELGLLDDEELARVFTPEFLTEPDQGPRIRVRKSKPGIRNRG